MLKALRRTAGRDASPASIDAGAVRWGHEVSIGTSAGQHRRDREKGSRRSTGCTSSIPTPRARTSTLLGQMLFSGEEG